MIKPVEAASPVPSVRERIIVALDVDRAEAARSIVSELNGRVDAFKVGLQLYMAAGPSFVRELVDDGAKVFLDLKFHDIPNTVAKAAIEATRLGVWMFNLHASGGSEMMRSAVSAVSAQVGSVRRFRVGERLSYNLAFGKFKDGGYAELFIASRGKLGGRDAVEVRAKFKTIDVVAASFMLFDETRTVYVDPAAGMPLFIRRTELNGPLPVETVSNYLSEPSTNFDIVSLIYRLRESGGTGTYTFTEGEQVYTATFMPGSSQHVKTDAGEFDTTVVSVQSEFLATRGIRDMRVNLTTDDARLPVMMRFKAQKGEFRATLAAVHIIPPSVVSQPGPDAAPTPTPITIQTPRPTPTPTPYVDNVPLLPELGFALGEKLNYRLSAADQPIGTIVFEAVERKEVNSRDAVLLTATVTGVDRPNQIFRPGDTFRTLVDPETLAPISVEGKFGPGIMVLNQSASFDLRNGAITSAGQKIDAPVGTHTILSLLYAMRSFNLTLSKITSNPVNDTRVAVFWNGKPSIFTLRPSEPADITLNGTKVSAQLIAITTGDAALDAAGVKVWLGSNSRVPVRIQIGQYQADLLQ